MSLEVPHADLIRAVLDGKTVEYLSQMGRGWVSCENPVSAIRELTMGTNYEFRIKPDPVVMWTLPKLTQEQFNLLTECIFVELSCRDGRPPHAELYRLIVEASTKEET